MLPLFPLAVKGCGGFEDSISAMDQFSMEPVRNLQKAACSPSCLISLLSDEEQGVC